MKLIAVTNQKGGVGKTTTAISIASGIVILKPEAKVLLIEADAQGNVKTYFKIKHLDADVSFGDLLILGRTKFNSSDLNHVPVGPLDSKKTIDVLMAGPGLRNADVKMAGFTVRETTLRERFKEIEPLWDYVIFDCPPTINVASQNVITAADFLLIPTTMDGFASTGIQMTMAFVKEIENAFSRKIPVLGILPTIFDSRVGPSHTYLEVIKDFGYKIFTPIPVDRKVRSALNNSRTVHRYTDSPASLAYLHVCKEILTIITKAESRKVTSKVTAKRGGRDAEAST